MLIAPTGFSAGKARPIAAVPGVTALPRKE